MKKRIFVTVIVVNGALVVSDYTADPYTGEHETGKSDIGASIDSLVGVDIDVFSSSRKDRGKDTLIGAAAGAAVNGGIGYYMGVQETELCEKMRGASVNVTRSGDNIILNMPNNVTSDSGSASLKLTDANTLTGVAMVLREYNRAVVNVLGFIDSTSSQDLNMCLSQWRIDSVVSALITQGTTVNRIRTQGMGPANLTASNSTAEGKAQGRRAEIILNPTW